ncbi:hypothetical protein LAZ67_6003022 [Cordylochernes scorpioides]|uniref:Reverse transcriptase domain-containing protein n=1 Tax=Cordylochernes scorpioides TaxID=51811 RepID=A0ABY6KK83_9ARAC|nr:hypothetical protein LAZ67_6003022 [Cordylochernes scorpioides]
MYLDNYKFIIPQKFGFRKGHSTTNQLIAVLDYIQIRRSHREVILRNAITNIDFGFHRYKEGYYRNNNTEVELHKYIQ